MPHPPSTDWQSQLTRAHNAAKATVTGLRNVQYIQHAKLLTTALLAFGDHPAATFYIETLTPNTNIPRPDLILLHPDVGVLVIENKGFTLEQVHAVEQTSIHLTRDGRLKEEDPFAQAERVMFALKDLAAQRLDLSDILFIRTAAFPRIRRFEFEQRFQSPFPQESLFSDACHDPDEFHRQILAYSKAAFYQQAKSHRLTLHAHEILTNIILSGKSIFTPNRRSPKRNLDAALLGAQIQDLELSLKTPTQQQKDLGRADPRGAHRLFRGVAGSGKSIMLALSAAQTLLLHRQEQPSLFQPKNPKRILVTCYNRSLVQYLRARITDRFARIAWDKPSDSELHVTHFEGLVKLLAGQRDHLQTNLSYDKKEERAALLCQRFDSLPTEEQRSLQFDAVFVDETQDLEPAELEFLRRLAKPDEKNNQTLLLFYDNAQNIYGTSAPTWSSLGINIVGRTQFLDQCLRNTQQTLSLAFNILVGSHAPDHLRVRTRQFADVASLRERNLIEEAGSSFNIRFAKRTGPPRVVLPTRKQEITAAVNEIHRLIRDEHVLPSDILILYNSHHPFKKDLAPQLEKILPPGYALRLVDSVHHQNKNLPLMDDSVLTLSTIASAKGYDAPIVFLLGIDQLGTTDADRARFYVAATRAKLLLYIFATQPRAAQNRTPSVSERETQIRTPSVSESGLIPEILDAAKAVPPEMPTPTHAPKPPAKLDEPSRFQDLAAPLKSTAPPFRCIHCGSQNLHCQQGGSGYYFLCIDCTQPTPIKRRCSNCGETARVRAHDRHFTRICTQCNHREPLHTNKPLDTF